MAANGELAIDPAVANVDDETHDSDLASITTSLASEVTNYKIHMGRRYHAYQEGSYVFPNDEKESDRLDIVHKMHQTAMNGKLTYAPIKQPKRILDLGTGTGIWAMEMGDQYPQAEVLGNDLSPIQPRWAPPNVRFEVDDVEAEWTYSDNFDFIRCCTLAPAIKDWPRLVRRCRDFAAPGGYCEFIDYDMTIRSPDDTVPSDSVLWQANAKFRESLTAAGMDACPGARLEQLVKDAGFVDVRATKIPLPIGTWPADKRLKEVGAWNFLQTIENVDSFVTYVFGQMMALSGPEVKELCEKLRVQLKDPKTHSLFYLYNVVGKVPEKS